MTLIIHLDRFGDRTFAFYTETGNYHRVMTIKGLNLMWGGAQRLQDATIHHCWHLKLNTGGWKTDTFNYRH